MRIPTNTTRYRMMDAYRFNRGKYTRYNGAHCSDGSREIPLRRKKESPLSSMGEGLLLRAPLLLSAIGFGLLDLDQLRKYSYGRRVR